jgi:hypothetical protein
MVLSLSACSTVGSYVEEDRAQEVISSVKTAQELSDALGIPSVTIPRADGTAMWVYEGVFRTANAASYIPYVGILAGRSNKKCTRLTAVVDMQTGAVSDVKYETAKDSDFWTTYKEKCKSNPSEESLKTTAEERPTPPVEASGVPVQ